ncbi:MAG: O-antigen ligase family protein, partial [Syntrophobacteraceae bacterium]|nr:O-antigen ligase family protein [Syntrophobacteraceae bacterium]
MGLHLPPHLALFLCIILIFSLFWLDSRRSEPVSRAIWVPATWFAMAASRPLDLWFSAGPAQDSSAEGSAISRAVYLVLILAGLLILSRRREKFSIHELVADNGPLFLLLGYFALAIIWSDFPFVSFKRYIKTFGMLMMILIILTDADPALALRTTLRRCGFVLLSLSFMLAKYFTAIGVSYDTWTGAQAVVGVASDKNMLGQICLVFGMGYLWGLVSEWSKSRLPKNHRLAPAIDIFMLLLAIHLLLLSHSDSSLVCMLFGSAVMLATRYASVRKRIGMYIVIGAITFLLLNSFSELIPSIVHALGRNMTLTGRTEIWQKLLSFAKENLLLGAGYEDFWMGQVLVRLRSMGMYMNEAHNGYLEIVLNTGLAGLFL